jgi:hypothetical protein
VRQQLEQQLMTHADSLIKQQRSSAQLQKAAQPLGDVLDFTVTLLNIWTLCFDLPSTKGAPATDTPASTKQALHTAVGLSKAAAAVTAVWRSESVLQACLPAIPKRSVKLDSASIAILRHSSCTVAAARLELHYSTLAAPSSPQPCTTPAPTAAVVTAASLDVVLQVILTHVALVVAHLHEGQQGKPSAPPGGATHSVPPNHKVFLQAAGTFRISLQDEGTPVPDLPAHYFSALDWAPQQLLCHMQEQFAAPDSQHTGHSSSSAGGCSNNRACDASSSQVNTAPAGTPHAGSINKRSCKSAASMQSMRLLQHLPDLLAELVALQLQLPCLIKALNTSAYCLSIAQKLQGLAANKQQPSQTESCTVPSGSAIMRGLYRSCLKVLVPVQQQLATPTCSTATACAGDGAACVNQESPHDALPSITAVPADCQAGVDPAAVDCCQAAKSLAGPLFRLLADSMAVFDPQHGECWSAFKPPTTYMVITPCGVTRCAVTISCLSTRYERRWHQLSCSTCARTSQGIH